MKLLESCRNSKDLKSTGLVTSIILISSKIGVYIAQQILFKFGRPSNKIGWLFEWAIFKRCLIVCDTTFSINNLWHYRVWNYYSWCHIWNFSILYSYLCIRVEVSL